MSEAIPKWMQVRYSQLYKTFKSKPFTIDDCVKVLKENREIVVVVLSRLRKMGWLNVEMNEKDIRKKFYTLKKPEEIFLTIEKKG